MFTQQIYLFWWTQNVIYFLHLLSAGLTHSLKGVSLRPPIRHVRCGCKESGENYGLAPLAILGVKAEFLGCVGDRGGDKFLCHFVLPRFCFVYGINIHNLCTLCKSRAENSWYFLLTFCLLFYFLLAFSLQKSYIFNTKLSHRMKNCMVNVTKNKPRTRLGLPRLGQYGA